MAPYEAAIAGLLSRARAVMPGGVNSPVRAFGAVGSDPPFIARADGCRLFDEEGRAYIDYVMSWGPMILGHNHPAVREAAIAALERGASFGAATKIEVEMAELVCEMVPNAEMVRMCSSGTEAAMSAVRLARGYTARPKILKFEGCYHGHSDAMLAKAGSGAMTFGVSGSAGVTEGAAADTILVAYNDLDAAREAFEANPGQMAAVIVEPLAANMGLVAPAQGFLAGLRSLADEAGALLIFDEVITGFRLGPGGAQAYYGVDADIVVLGKIIGGGMPVGCYGASREIMSSVSPLGPVYQAGTLSGNPVAMASGYAQLSYLHAHPEVYTTLAESSARLFGGIELALQEAGIAASVAYTESLGCLFFAPSLPQNYEEAQNADAKAFGEFHTKMLASGVYIAPSQFEAWFVSAAHDDEAIQATLEAVRGALLS